MLTHRTFLDLLIRSVMAVLLGIGLALLLNTRGVAGDIHLDQIQTRTDLYQNVTVTGHNETDLYITHSRGMANVKIKDLDPETLWRVGLGEKPLEPGSPEAVAAAEAATRSDGKMPAALAKVLESAAAPIREAELQQQVASMTGMQPISIDQVDPKHLMILGGILLAFHLCFSFCLKLIVQKTGTEPGFMVWLPLFQVFPMLRAAGMSGWWVLALLIPFVNIIAQIVWCVKIVQARGKSVWVTLLLILPVTNLFAFLYLAFSSAGESESNDSGSGRIIVQSAFADA